MIEDIDLPSEVHVCGIEIIIYLNNHTGQILLNPNLAVDNFMTQ